MTNKPLRVLSGGILLAFAIAGGARAGADTLATAPVTTVAGAGTTSFAAVVEAIRQTVLAAQVAGSVREIRVKPGDTVRAGQVLIRLDASAAEQTAASGDAQVIAARALLDVATQDYERKQQLLKKNYISQAAFERAQAQYQATQAQVSAQVAQASAAHAQSGFFVVTAPYAGVVAEVPVAIGDMALPGKPLVSLYDPLALRVTAAVPQSAATVIGPAAAMKVEIPGVAGDRRWIVPSHVQILPTIDPATHTVEIRLDLPRDTTGISPGMFARAWVPAQAMPSEASSGGTPVPSIRRLFVPATAIVRRAELTALYVVEDGGRPVLRQVRLGEHQDDRVEVLSGVSEGEGIALDPQAAARVR